MITYAHARRLVRLALRGRTDPELEAAAWDGLRRALEKFDAAAGDFDAWARYVMRSHISNQYRAWRTRRHLPGAACDVADVVVCTAPRRDPQLQRAAAAALAALPERQALAARLCLIEGRSHADAAGVLGVTPPAVTGLVQRAQSRLRRALRAYENA